jgi:serine/threonine protein phosphatase PrpC
MKRITAFSDVDIGSLSRKRLEDVAVDALIRSAGGLTLQIGLVCDGVASSERGIQAARDTAQVILDFLENSTETNMPRLLVAAVEAANEHVYQNIPNGNTTVALLAINLGENRLYIASLGDSPIFMVRDGTLLRLNTDHTVANEAILDGMSPQDAYLLDEAYALTRAIGADASADVDIGFYPGGRPSRRQAWQLGEVGLRLQDGDTIFAVSDGMTGINPRDNQPFVHDDEFIRHAMDDDVALAARTLLSYAKSRTPNDNLAISLIFVGSDDRTNRGARKGQKRLLTVATLLIVLALGYLGLSLLRTTNERDDLEATQLALTSSAEAAQTIAAFTQTPTSTTTPSATTTASATVTASPTLTDTAMPTSTSTLTPSPQTAPRDVGRLFREASGQSIPLQEGEIIPTSERITRIEVDGSPPANLFLQPGTQILIDRVGEQSVELLLYAGGAVFVDSGQYTMELSLQQDANIRLMAQSACISASYTDDNTVAFSCFSDEEGSCSFELQRGEPNPIGANQVVLLDLQNRASEQKPIAYDEALVYYQSVNAVGADDSMAACLLPHIDGDADGVLNDADDCPSSAGVSELNGCLDSDNDGIPDTSDACPNFFGTASNGCRPDGCCRNKPVTVETEMSFYVR